MNVNNGLDLGLTNFFVLFALVLVFQDPMGSDELLNLSQAINGLLKDHTLDTDEFAKQHEVRHWSNINFLFSG